MSAASIHLRSAADYLIHSAVDIFHPRQQGRAGLSTSSGLVRSDIMNGLGTGEDGGVGNPSLSPKMTTEAFPGLGAFTDTLGEILGAAFMAMQATLESTAQKARSRLISTLISLAPSTLTSPSIALHFSLQSPFCPLPSPFLFLLLLLLGSPREIQKFSLS